VFSAVSKTYQAKIVVRAAKKYRKRLLSAIFIQKHVKGFMQRRKYQVNKTFKLLMQQKRERAEKKLDH
jgi:hypothetical protein